MKKIIIALIVLLIAAGGSIGAFMYAKNKKDKDNKSAEEKVNEKNLFSFDSSTIEKVDFALADGTSYTAEKKNDNWELTKGGSFSLDQDYFNLLCTYVCDLKATGIYEKDEDKLGAYGLDKPNVITLYSANNEYSLNVGGISPTQDSYYITLDDRDKVYTISSYEGSVFQVSRVMLRSKQFVPYKNREIAEISVARNGKNVYTIKYDPENDSWSPVGSFPYLTFDTTAVQIEAAAITGVSANITNMLEESPEDLSKYGLDKPEYTAVIKGLDGTERNISFNTSYDKQNGLTCVYIKEEDLVMAVYTADIAFATYTVKNYFLNQFTSEDISNVASFEYTQGDTSCTVNINSEDGTADINGTPFDPKSDNNNFKNFFYSLTALKIEEIDDSVSPEMKDPAMTAVLHKTDGSDVTYQLVDAGNDLYYIFINGDYTKALTSKSTLTGKNSIAYFYDEFAIECGIKN